MLAQHLQHSHRTGRKDVGAAALADWAVEGWVEVYVTIVRTTETGLSCRQRTLWEMRVSKLWWLTVGMMVIMISRTTLISTWRSQWWAPVASICWWWLSTRRLRPRPHRWVRIRPLEISPLSFIPGWRGSLVFDKEECSTVELWG